MRIVITGVPGTGKSMLAERLARELGYRLVRINDVVDEKSLWEGKDRFGSKVVRMDELGRRLRRLMKEDDIIVEGHLACELKLPADIVIVCRTNPSLLKRRLGKRGYPDEKRDENVMAEMLDYCTILSLKNYPEDIVYEIETRGKEGFKEVMRILRKERGWKRMKAGWVDWSYELERELSRRKRL